MNIDTVFRKQPIAWRMNAAWVLVSLLIFLVAAAGAYGIIQVKEAALGDLQAASSQVGPLAGGLAAQPAMTFSEHRMWIAVEAIDSQATARNRIENAAADATMALTMTALAAVALVALLTHANAGSIVKATHSARDAARAMAEGDLDVAVNRSGDDELSDLSRALEDMRLRFRSIVGNVRSAADSIQVASSEVAAGNLDLSQRTEHTASNLQQTASSVSQLASKVRQNADAASQANQLAQSASDAARRGGEVVTQVVTNMQDISSSSRRIADIISTIDGIAFQTNILALNAAVEAARAGEQGRGFAVVAGEVRSLAQRSAEAAREIKTLIGTSVEKVEAGSRLVEVAGSSMSEIVTSVQRVTDIISEISAATVEQHQGIEQVNRVVSELDQMTQQNAALVEQSAAAAASLSDQAKRLTSAIGGVGQQGFDSGSSDSSWTGASRKDASVVGGSPRRTSGGAKVSAESSAPHKRVEAQRRDEPAQEDAQGWASF